jgi:hypothetical protein
MVSRRKVMTCHQGWESCLSMTNGSMNVLRPGARTAHSTCYGVTREVYLRPWTVQCARSSSLADSCAADSCVLPTLERGSSSAFVRQHRNNGRRVLRFPDEIDLQLVADDDVVRCAVRRRHKARVVVKFSVENTGACANRQLDVLLLPIPRRCEARDGRR